MEWDSNPTSSRDRVQVSRPFFKVGGERGRVDPSRNHQSTTRESQGRRVIWRSVDAAGVAGNALSEPVGATSSMTGLTKGPCSPENSLGLARERRETTVRCRSASLRAVFHALPAEWGLRRHAVNASTASNRYLFSSYIWRNGGRGGGA